MYAMITVSLSSCFCSGVLSALVLFNKSAMLPISVPIPVVVTIISACPRDLRCSYRPCNVGHPGVDSALAMVSVSLGEATLSPVRALSPIPGGGDKQATICRDAIARLHQHNISWHQLPRHSPRLPGRFGARGRCSFIVSASAAKLASALASLTNAQDGIEDRQTDQHKGGSPISDENLVDDGRAKQDELHEVLILS